MEGENEQLGVKTLSHHSIFFFFLFNKASPPPRTMLEGVFNKKGTFPHKGDFKNVKISVYITLRKMVEKRAF